MVFELHGLDEPDVHAVNRHPAPSDYDTELPSTECHHVFRSEHECEQVVIDARFVSAATYDYVYDDTQQYH